MTKDEPINIEQVARVCHEAVRAYCLTIGDPALPIWDAAPEWQKQSVRDGVLFHIQNPTAAPRASHENWVRFKERDGWKYGTVKDPEKKEHPCMVRFDELPLEQQVKDALFRAIVHAITEDPAW